MESPAWTPAASSSVRGRCCIDSPLPFEFIAAVKNTTPLVGCADPGVYRTTLVVYWCPCDDKHARGSNCKQKHHQMPSHEIQNMVHQSLLSCPAPLGNNPNLDPLRPPSEPEEREIARVEGMM